jgi:hypothetical protein
MARYDLLSPRSNNRDDRTYFHKVGAMFENANGDGFNIVFDSLPLPDKDGQVRLIAKLPLERDGEREGQRTRQEPARNERPVKTQTLQEAVKGDEIPF